MPLVKSGCIERLPSTVQFSLPYSTKADRSSLLCLNNSSTMQLNLPPKWQQWLKRFGIAGFLFFTLKGLAWLAVFFFVGKCSGL
jgi:hypothetical protein